MVLSGFRIDSFFRLSLRISGPLGAVGLGLLVVPSARALHGCVYEGFVVSPGVSIGDELFSSLETQEGR